MPFSQVVQTKVVIDSGEEHASSLSLQKRKANEKWIEKIFTMIKEQGSWTWVDEREIYIKYGNKIVCNKEAYNKLALIVNNKWLRKNVKVIRTDEYKTYRGCFPLSPI